jgi:signal transduction histidine kinase
MTIFNPIEIILKETGALTEACWAVRVAYRAQDWVLLESWRLSKLREAALRSFLFDKSNSSWLGGVLSVRRSRSRAANLDNSCSRVYAFPEIGEGQSLLLVGVEEALSKDAQQIWRVASLVLESAGGTQEQTRELKKAVSELEEIQQELQARIVAQREAESRLVQAAKLAAVGEMAAGIAHELNNPLTTVVGFTELSLESLPSDSGLRNDLELILREANRARSVVRRLLDFARQREVLKARADINEIVDDVVALTKHLLLTSHVRLELFCGAELPWVLVDRNQIKQVLINLINNALYAMPEGGNLALETSQTMRHGSPFLALTVRDNGEGIAPEILDRIFEPFFTTRGDSGGTGLGLSVTYGIITEHGGMIEVESQLHQGAIFTVLLPLEN